MTEPISAAPTGQEPTSATPGQEPTTSTDTQAVKSQQDYEKMLADLRKENAAHRTKLKTFEEQEAARQLAALSDAEKAQARAEQAEKQIKQYQEQLVHAEIKIAAQGKNIINPDLIADTIFKQLEFEDGKPTNLDKALDDIIKSNPYLIKQEGQTPAQKGAPHVPAMNPGRSQIAQPGTLPTGKTLSWNDFYTSKKR